MEFLLTFNRVLLHSSNVNIFVFKSHICGGVSVRLIVILYNIPCYILHAKLWMPVQGILIIPFQQLYLFLTCPYSTTRAPVAPGCLVLPLHCLNVEAKSMNNGLCGIHPSKPGILSAAFIHLSDLIPGSLAPVITCYIHFPELCH